MLRRASSLIIARKIADTVANHSFDYKILFLKRASKLKWAEILAYPGGIVEDADVQYVKRNFSHSQNLSDPEVFDYNVFKVASLRETYEETGLLFLENGLLKTDEINVVNNILKNSLKENKLPSFFECADLLKLAYGKSLVEISRMVSVPHFPNRYNCQFFVCVAEPEKTLNIYKAMEGTKYLHDLDDLVVQKSESSEYRWLNPYELLTGALNKTIKLAPPQYMLANIMMSFPKIETLQNYLNNIRIKSETVNKDKDAFERNPLTYPLMIGMANHTEAKFLNRGYKIAGLFPTDVEYPLDKFLSMEKDPAWKQEMDEKVRNLDARNRGVCRIYFSQMKEMFDADYDFEIQSQVDFPFQYMVGLEELKKKLMTIAVSYPTHDQN